MNDAGHYMLLTWSSPAYPIGGFSYSHGLEWAVEARSVARVSELEAFLEAVLTRGGGWVDAVLFVHAWRMATRHGAGAELDEIIELAGALRGSAETALESRQQGSAFMQVTRRAWPHRLLEEVTARVGEQPMAHCVAMAIACAAHGVELEQALLSYLHAFTANLISAGARLIPLGQTDAQLAVARLAPLIATVRDRALRADLRTLGTATPLLELNSLWHETQYTRLFRS
jgi:urease accessory protein